MFPELTPEQRAKLARGWVWQVGHAAVWTGAQGTMPVRVALDPQVPEYLVVLAMDGGHNAVKVANLTPDLNDPVTADGLLRTARAVTGIPSLVAVMVGPGRDGRARWALQRMVWDHGAEYQLLTATRWGGLGIPMMWESEPAALLAAILTAPEAA